MMLGWLSIYKIFNYKQNCASILYSFIVDLKIFFRANKNPVFLCRHAYTSPNFPDPIELPI
jgi:hypothetical protein